MKHLIICLALAGCSLGGVNSASSQAVIGADDVYTAAERAGQALVQNNLMDKAAFKTDAAAAYKVLLAIRAGQATMADLIKAIQPLTGAK